jgi:hypothetical protein
MRIRALSQINERRSARSAASRSRWSLASKSPFSLGTPSRSNRANHVAIRLINRVLLNRATWRRPARPNQHLHPVAFSAGSKVYSAAQSPWKRLRNPKPNRARASIAKTINGDVTAGLAGEAVIRATIATISPVTHAMSRKANARIIKVVANPASKAIAASKVAAADADAAEVAVAIATIVADHNPKDSRVAGRSN